MKRLTDEEIRTKYRELWEELNTEDTVLEEDEDALDVMRKMLEAQLKKMVDLLKSKTIKAWGGNRIILSEDWEALLKEVENEYLS